MKKPSIKRIRWLKRRQEKLKRAQLKEANLRRRQKQRLIRLRKRHPVYYEVRDNRQRVIREVYRRRRYEGNVCDVEVKGSFGIEVPSDSPYFFETAAKIVGFQGRELRLMFENCSRVWPSAIAMLCSLGRWVELTSVGRKRHIISSTTPADPQVAGYLTLSGFYDYVGRQRDTANYELDPHSIVKIEREESRDNLDRRAEELEEFARNHCQMDVNGFDLFKCVMLAEILNNITEHGRPHGGQGWWLMAQVHPTHRFASICLADNGVGFGNSLRTGWQAKDLRSQMGQSFYKDGECIRKAFEPDVSGSVKAPPGRKSLLGRKFQRGSRKGMGLTRMRDCCRSLGIRLSILSHHGYIVIDEKGTIVDGGTYESRVFAGTMYHLMVKTNH